MRTATVTGTLAPAVDALAVVMSFEQIEELFMRTSCTTGFLDYEAFTDHILGPYYSTSSPLARHENAKMVVHASTASAFELAGRRLEQSVETREKYGAASRRLKTGLFNHERLQALFEVEIERTTGG